MSISDSRDTILSRNTGSLTTVSRCWHLLQLLCCFQAWIENGPYDCLWESERYEKIDQTILSLGDLIKKCVKRDERRLQKFHDLFCHLLDGIRECGSGKEVDTGVSERMHKYYCKLPAATLIQHSENIFNVSVASRIAATQFLTQCRNIMGMTEFLEQQDLLNMSNKILKSFRPKLKSTSSNPNHVLLRGKPIVSFSPTQEYTNYHNDCGNNYKKIMDAWYENSRFHNDGTELFIYPEVQVGDSFICSHPNYQSRGEWFDWVLVQWEEHSSTIDRGNYHTATSLWTPQHLKKREIVCTPFDHALKETDDVDNGTASDGESVQFFVPAKVLGFYYNSDGVKMAIVHSAETHCHTNSLFTRQWPLRHQLSSVHSIEI